MSTEYRRVMKSQNTVVDLEPLSRIPGGEEHDIASVSTTIHLASPEQSEVLLVLPTSTDPQAAYLRVLDDNDTNPFKTVDLGNLDPEARDVVGGMIGILQKYAKGFNVNRFRVEQGSQELRLYYREDVKANQDGTFEWTFIAPFSSFTLEGGATIALHILMPRDPNLEVLRIEAVGPDASLVIEQPTDVTVAGRRIVSWLLKYDPVFKIVYRYRA